MSPTEQMLSALERANAVRTNGAARAQGLAVGRVLTAQKRWGPAKANKLLNRHGIWPTRRVRDLTKRQRRVLREALGDSA